MTGSVVRSRSGEMHVPGAGPEPSEAEKRATVLAVLYQLEMKQITATEAGLILAELGLLDTAAQMRGAQRGVEVVLPQPQYGLCGRGLHVMSPENTRLRSDHGRQCRQCVRDADKRRREAKRGAA